MKYLYIGFSILNVVKLDTEMLKKKQKKTDPSANQTDSMYPPPQPVLKMIYKKDI